MRSSLPVVLIVDDQQDSLAMYSFGLLAMGFQPLMAESAEEGFSRACELHPDVVVANVSQTGVSGLELTRRLREDARTKDAGIIVLAEKAGPAAKREASDAGCDRFMLNPGAPDVLAVVIHDVLSVRLAERRYPI